MPRNRNTGDHVPPPVRILPGPRKRPPSGLPPSRLTTHKRRSAWFQARAAWPFREAPASLLAEARSVARTALAPAAGGNDWELAGPTNVGGRVTSLICHPTDANTIWLGSAGGGVWKSLDAGQSWERIWDDQSETLNIGSLALDPADSNRLYCGTGEANLSADSYAGVGLYRSEDGGTTWAILARSEDTGLPSRIGVIAVDPFDSQHLLVGGIGFDRGEHQGTLGGLYISRDGGTNWARETFISTNNYWCHSVVFDPDRQGRIYATFTENGARNGIWRSTDGGQNWSQLTKGLPSPDRFDRTSLAQAPSKTSVIYALAATKDAQVLGVFRSSNGGDSWHDVTAGHFVKERQMSYGNTIAVHPRKPDFVICGGVDLHLTRDGGKTWRRVTRWNARRGLDSDYAHADHHALVLPAAAPGRIYDGNDGGMDISENEGGAWINRSSDLAVTMYYDMDVSAQDARLYGGGTQDNGTQITRTGGVDDHYEILGGDGGWIVFDPNDAGHFYASAQNMYLSRWRDGQPTYVSPPVDEREARSVWMAFVTLDPDNSEIVYTGSYRIWKTEDDGLFWDAVSPDLDGSSITAIEVAPADSRRIYVGTENGGLFRSLDSGISWSEDLSGASLPGRTITRIETGPRNADLVFVTVASFGNSHVFRSQDGGRNWEDVDRGHLPDAPCHAVAIPRDTPQTVYVCGDAGVFVSPDLGETWEDLTRNLPNVMVVDIVYHQATASLFLATYGRSLWRLALP